MEPNKYDTDFRNKLNNREITPSADSWNTLDAMLNTTPEKKKKPMIWLYIAAGIIGFLFVGNLFLMQIGDSSSDIQVVNQENPALIQSSGAVLENGNLNEEIVEVQPEHKIIQENNNSIEEIEEVQTQQKVLRDKKSQNAIAKVIAPVNQKSTNLCKEEVALAHNPTIPVKTIRNIVNDNYLEKLLAEASSTQTTTPTVKINAKNLLSQVDTEIEHTFREKMIRSVTKNYQEIKVAVSNRNLESY